MRFREHRKGRFSAIKEGALLPPTGRGSNNQPALSQNYSFDLVRPVANPQQLIKAAEINFPDFSSRGTLHQEFIGTLPEIIRPIFRGYRRPPNF